MWIRSCQCIEEAWIKSIADQATSIATAEMDNIAPAKWLMELIFIAVGRGDQWGEGWFLRILGGSNYFPL